MYMDVDFLDLIVLNAVAIYVNTGVRFVIFAFETWNEYFVLDEYPCLHNRKIFDTLT